MGWLAFSTKGRKLFYHVTIETSKEGIVQGSLSPVLILGKFENRFPDQVQLTYKTTLVQIIVENI